jgi:hypothetical protein
MMHSAHLAISINDKHELTITHVRHPGEDDPLQIEIALPELNADGLDKAIHRVGHWTLATLSQWYPDAWNRYPNLVFPLSSQPDLDLIYGLTAKSSALKTTAFVSAIDLLVQQVIKDDPQAAQQPVITSWPDIRAHLMKGE